MGKFSQELSYLIYKTAVKWKPVITKLIPLEKMQGVKQRIFQTGIDGQKRTEALDSALPFGVNLVGYLSSWLGLGQGARLLAAAMEQAGLPFCGIDVPTGVPTIRTGPTRFDHTFRQEPAYNINILHTMPDEGLQVMLMNRPRLLSGRYNIGFWMFELDEIPATWVPSFQYVNEVWTPSRFATEAFAKVSGDVPVYTMPYGIDTPVNERLTRGDFGLPEDAFLVLTMFDSGSTAARKNPLDAIRAFSRAFHNTPEAILVIKIHNTQEKDLELLEKEMAGANNYILIDQSFSQEDVNRLISLCDVYLSLHRSEGFGLPVAEAMNLGTVVVSTDYSATTDFVSETTGCPVPYTLVDVGEAIKDHHLYVPGKHWAQPDVKAAAGYLRHLYEDRDYYRSLQQSALAFMKQEYSPKACGDRLKERLDVILKTFPKA